MKDVDIKIRPSTRPTKKLMAVFDGGRRTVHFGCASCGDYVSWSAVDRRLADRKRAAYLKRHGAPAAREKWGNFASPGALSRWILWEKRSLPAAIAAYKRRAAGAAGAAGR